MVTRKLTLFVSLFIVVLYLFTLKGSFDIPFISQTICPFESSHECAPFANMQSIIHYGSNSLNNDLIAFARIDIGFYKGSVYSLFPPGLSIIAIPFYLIGKIVSLGQVFAFSFVMVCALLNGLLLYKISRYIFKLSERASLMAPILFLLSSTAWSYGITFFQHHLTTIIFLGSFWLIWKGSQSPNPNWKYTYLPIILYALSGHIDYPNLFLLAPIVIYLLLSIVRNNVLEKNKWLLISKLLGVLVVLGLSYPLYNTLLFGNWRIMQNRLPHPREVVSSLTLAQEFEQEKAITRSSLMYIFVLNRLPHGLYVLLFSFGRGLFVYSPMFIFIFFTLRKKFFHVAPLEQALVWATPVLFLMLYGTYGDVYGGLSYGPRFLVPVMALLSLLIAQYIDILKNKALIIVLFVAITYSQALALLGALTRNINLPCTAQYTIVDCTLLMNIGMLLNNGSNSFIYKTFFENKIPLVVVFFVLLICIVALSSQLMFPSQSSK